MSPASRTVALAAALVVAALAFGCTSAPRASATPTTARVEQDVPVAGITVWNGSYAADIQPIFDQNCVSCHGSSRAENGLRLDNYANVMRGTQYGAVVVPGSTATSTLVAVIQGNTAPEIRMPHEGRRLTKNRIQNILLWIEAGAPNK